MTIWLSLDNEKILTFWCLTLIVKSSSKYTRIIKIGLKLKLHLFVVQQIHNNPQQIEQVKFEFKYFYRRRDSVYLPRTDGRPKMFAVSR